jgi:S1-C subfamily serine protease
MDDVLQTLPKLKEGKTLRKGRIGVLMKQDDPVMSESEITSVTLDSPASKLGLQPGDKITNVDGKAIKNQAQFQHAMGPKYEGDTVSLKVKRGDKELSFDKLNTHRPTCQPHPCLSSASCPCAMTTKTVYGSGTSSLIRLRPLQASCRATAS